MTFFQGALSAVASTTVAATTIRTQMRTTIPGNTAWTLVESTTMNAGAVPCDVYKCAAASSGRSADFYVAVMQNGAALILGLAEGYNTTTHKPKRPALLPIAALQTLQADGGITLAASELDWFNGTYNPGGGSMSVNTTATISPAVTDDYAIFVAKDGIFLSIRTTASGVYAGAYDSLVPTPATNDPLPLAIMKSGSTFGATALRNPLCGGASIGYAGSLNGASAAAGPAAALLNNWNLGTLGAAANDNFDRYLNSVSADKFAVLNSYIPSSTTIGRNINGYLRGTWRLLRGISTVAGAVWADTATIDGVSYFAVIPSTTQASSLWVESNPA